MSRARLPAVLIVDDEPDEVSAQELALSEHVSVAVRTPHEVTAVDLRHATVVLVDYELSNWDERDALRTVSLKPQDGVALIAVLRSYAERRISRSPKSFAVHSGKLPKLGGGLPAPSREHAIARTLNLEWAFSKSGGAETLLTQVRALATATAELPSRWPAGGEAAELLVTKLLAIPKDVAWRDRVLSDVEASRPPAHAWATATSGLAFLRWLLHQILPYPCFLWDEHYLAARLRVTTSSLREALISASGRRALRDTEYEGMLAEFSGRRWWRKGVEQLIWNWTGGNPFDATVLRDVVTSRISPNLVAATSPNPVVCVDQAFRPTDRQIDVGDAVEIFPDDWPSNAEQAWMPRADLAADPELAILAARSDRASLGLPK